MPTYVYRRTDGSTFEIQQRITSDSLDRCPTTGQGVQRVITGGTGLIFKGTGFYQTDYASRPDPEKPKPEKVEEAKKPEAKKETTGTESATADAD